MSKRYFLDPFGCAKNQVDAENMMAFLGAAGWTACADALDADLIIVNSCGFIEDAKRESINAVLSWRSLYPEKKILLAGCLPRRYPVELAEELSEADGFFGGADLSLIAEAASASLPGKTEAGRKKARPEKRASGETGFEQAGRAGERPLLGFPGQAYVKISEGCDNHCSFCAIPLIRGPLCSRSISDVTAECKTLLGRGVKELCLIGQDLSSYRPAEGAGLRELAAEIARIDGDFWLRFLYLHPDHFPLDLLPLMRKDSRFLPYFDIPFQHGSPSVLKAMRRRGSGESYLELLNRIRDALPDAVIRSTFLTGFPGETEEDFGMLVDFQQKALFDWLGVFVYSREEATPAYSMKQRVGKKTAERRKAFVEETQIPITEKRMERFVGRRMEVLVEECLDPPAKDPSDPSGASSVSGLYLGRLFCQAPEVDGAAVIHSGAAVLEAGDLVPCRTLRRAGFDLEVEPDGLS
ncbi:MAG: 30S ribosomal protein S12 methylthiotransferase RimO [Treponema sp.]|nr:30S ribosomal protein S12 methylthiotransferase RimO [Treponema sp.]